MAAIEEDDDPTALLRYLQSQGKLDPVSTKPSQVVVTTSQDERDALMKYLSRKGVRLEAPVAHATLIPESETIDPRETIVEARFDQMWLDRESDTRSTEELRTEVPASIF